MPTPHEKQISRQPIKSRNLLGSVDAVLPALPQKNEDDKKKYSHREYKGDREQSCQYLLQNVELRCQQKPNNS